MPAKKSQQAEHICTVSTPQHGYITRTQLLGLGLSKTGIWRQADLFPRHAGVYAVAYREVLPDRDVTVNYGIRVTTVVRTIIDVAPRRSDRELVRVINDARLAGQLKPTALTELLARCPKAKRLIDPAQNATRSRFEDDFMRWINRHHLPVPIINRRNGRTEADAVFPQHKVIIELDTYGTHGDPVSFRNDRARDRRNAASGDLPLRLTPDDLTDPEAHRLREILSARE